MKDNTYDLFSIWISEVGCAFVVLGFQNQEMLEKGRNRGLFGISYYNDKIAERDICIDLFWQEIRIALPIKK